MINVEEIVAWHKTTFPDASENEQKIKFLEEYREYLESHDINELADMCIVNVALNDRYNCAMFDSILGREIKEFGDDELLLQAITHKMSINKERKWHKVEGIYRHRC